MARRIYAERVGKKYQVLGLGLRKPVDLELRKRVIFGQKKQVFRKPRIEKVMGACSVARLGVG
jgi:hypothetical protein